MCAVRGRMPQLALPMWRVRHCIFTEVLLLAHNSWKTTMFRCASVSWVKCGVCEVHWCILCFTEASSGLLNLFCPCAPAHMRLCTACCARMSGRSWHRDGSRRSSNRGRAAHIRLKPGTLPVRPPLRTARPALAQLSSSSAGGRACAHSPQ